LCRPPEGLPLPHPLLIPLPIPNNNIQTGSPEEEEKITSHGYKRLRLWPTNVTNGISECRFSRGISGGPREGLGGAGGGAANSFAVL